MVMLVAVIEKYNLQEQTRLSYVLQEICKFYGWHFLQTKVGIDIRQQSILYDKQEMQIKSAELQVRDPLNNGKIMTKNCYKFA